LKPATTEERAALKAELEREAWHRGILFWKLHSDQKAVYQAMMLVTAARYVLEIARRWGKTWLFCVVAIEACLGGPKRRVVYGAPTLKDLQEFIIPTIEAIIEDAPASCRPHFDANKLHWTFPNGSYIHLFGCDDKRKANRGRGAGAFLVILDECGFIPILRYVIKSVLRPQLLHSGGRMLLGSTPAEQPDHDFTAICERAEANGNYSRRTIYDNPRLTPERIQVFIEDDAKEEGLTPEAYRETDDFRREYMAERVVNKLLVVLPEWEAMRGKLLVPIERPEFFNGQSVLDPGGNDPHAVQFGYYHFKLAAYVIEDELLLRNGENTAELVSGIQAKEKELWGTKLWNGTLRGATEKPTDELMACLPEWMSAVLDKHTERSKQPFARWSDTNIQLVRDLYELHGVAFIPTQKHDKEIHVNNLRVHINASKVYVNPRCVHTDRHFRSTTWANHKRKDYARKAGEHGDLVDCATYGVRNLDKRNPEPIGWGLSPDALPSERMRIEAQAKDRSQALTRAFLNGTPLGRKIAKTKHQG
jgi:hypothetical protein